jgi:hypothetical protein
MGMPPTFPVELFVCVWVILVIAGFVGWIYFLIAAWRGMKAHESIAHSLQVLAGRLDFQLKQPPESSPLGGQAERTQ